MGPLQAWRERVAWAVDTLLSRDVPTDFPRRGTVGQMIRFDEGLSLDDLVRLRRMASIQLKRQEWHGLVMALRICSGCQSHHEASAVLMAIAREPFIRANERNGLAAAIEWMREETERFAP